jgi:hypothetical protein
MKHISMVSTVALLGFGTAGLAGAQTYGDDAESKPKMSRSDFCAQNPDACAPRKQRQVEVDDVDEDDVIKKKRVRMDDDDEMKVASKSDWEFNPKHHKRSRHKDATFRFWFNGFYYPEQYWLVGVPVGYPRISCWEGRQILRDRGYYRIRTVECNGRAFTYVGNRRGDTFRVSLSSRTGRVLDRDRIS